MMSKTLSLGGGTLLLAFTTVQAALDIVPKDGAGTLYLLKNTDTGKVLGTFWDRQNEKSDYGFESSIVPDFVWSADRSYVAVTAGASRSRAVSLYRVTGNSLKPIEVPQLSANQASEIDAIDEVSASGTDAVRWMPNGELLLRFWAAPRVTSDTEESNQVSVWAEVEVNGDKALIGIWSSAGSSKTNHEAILIGNADMTQATIDPVPINGKYRSLREFAHVQVESLVTISGGDTAKTVRWTDSEGQTTKRQGLALGDGFAVLTPSGLSVFVKGSDASASDSLVGMALLKDGTSDSESLHPIP